MNDDASLLQRYAEGGSEAAFAEVVGRHLGLVYGTALRHLEGDTHGAKDVAQAVFVLLAQKARSLRSHPSLAGWLFRTACFKASEIRREEWRRKRREREAGAMNETAVNTASPVDSADMSALIQPLVLELRERDREAVLLRYLEGLPFDQIAVRLRVTEGAAHKRVERALEKLRQRLHHRGIAFTAAALVAGLEAHADVSLPAGLASQVTGAALAASGGVSTAGILTLMNATKLTAVAALAGIFAVGLAWRETAVYRRSAAELASLDQAYGAKSAKFRQLEKQARSMEEGVGDLAATSVGGAATAGGNAADTAARGAKAAKPAGLSRQQLEQNPRVHAALGKLVDWNNQHYFGPILQSKGLSPSQIERAENLLGQLNSFGGYGSTPLSFKTDPRSSAEIQSEFMQVAGESSNEIFDEYTLQRQVIDNLAGALYADEPLTAQQGSQLSQIAESAIQNLNGGGPQDAWSEMTTQAQNVLSPGQYAVLKDLVASRFGVDTQ